MSTTLPGAPARASIAPSTPPDPPSPRRRASASWQRWISPVAIVVVWQLASSTGLLAEDELASPWRVVTAAADVTVSGELPEGLAVSLARVVAGFLLGAVVGLRFADVIDRRFESGGRWAPPP